MNGALWAETEIHVSVDERYRELISLWVDVLWSEVLLAGNKMLKYVAENIELVS